MPVLVSPDNRWWWDGTRWRSRLVEGDLDLFWFTTTPEWLNRVLLMGLIGLIPIVGAIVILGWTLNATDMVQRRWKELPPAGFQYLERGVAPFVVGLAFALSLFIVVSLMVFLIVVLAMSGRAAVVGAVAVALVLILVIVAWWVASLFLYASVLMGSDRLGIVQALDPRRLLELARANQDVSIRVGLIYLAGSLVFATLGASVSFVIPLGGLVVSLALPALYAALVPSLARFQVHVAPPPPPAAPAA